MPDRIRDHYDVLCPLNAIICHHRHQRGVDFPGKNTPVSLPAATAADGLFARFPTT